MSFFQSYHFSSIPKTGGITVPYHPQLGVQFYDAKQGYGFVNETCAMPSRKFDTSAITADRTGFYIKEPPVEQVPVGQSVHGDDHGMAFRFNAPPGTYELLIKVAKYSAEPWISIAGMNAEQLLQQGTWDAAGKVNKRHIATFKQRYWQFQYVNGSSFIEIEIEPKHRGQKVGIEAITIKQVSSCLSSDDHLPTMFLLGDSTVKTYTFEEAPMSGWGQVFPHLFNLNDIRIINYAMGGRSFRNAYAEGRLNDLLLTGCAGDYVLIQFGHNDEREDEHDRFGRGSTEAMYEAYVKNVYIPAVRVRGMIPILITPPSRVNGAAKPGHVYHSSFVKRKFPELLKRIGKELQVPVIDLNAASVAYYNEIGVEATTALFMAIEAGETPGKTSDGSYANGHPAQKIDGTHYKEALSKQFARLLAAQCVQKGIQGDHALATIASYLKPEVKRAIAMSDWSEVYPEIAKDTTTGAGSYYRDQIEKMLQLGVMSKDEHGRFHPDEIMDVYSFIRALSQVLSIPSQAIKGYDNGELTREVMGALLYDAYKFKFKTKPRYMTDYNENAARAARVDHDPNLDYHVQGIKYDPIISFGQLTDTHLLAPELKEKVKRAYALGLFRSERGIARGKNMNGTALEPKYTVTRAKAAKALYYMWVLAQPVLKENHLIH